MMTGTMERLQGPTLVSTPPRNTSRQAAADRSATICGIVVLTKCSTT
jgi:hypothetical protein